MSPEVENTRSDATYEAYMYGAQLIVGMLIDYFTCIALKIVVLEKFFNDCVDKQNEQLKV